MLEVEERRDFELGEGSRDDDPSKGDSDRPERLLSSTACGPKEGEVEPGVIGRVIELDLFNAGSDLARARDPEIDVRMRELSQGMSKNLRAGGIKASMSAPCFSGAKLEFRDGGANST